MTSRYNDTYCELFSEPLLPSMYITHTTDRFSIERIYHSYAHPHNNFRNTGTVCKVMTPITQVQVVHIRNAIQAREDFFHYYCENH